MSDGQTITGRKYDDGYDFYETPDWATKKVVEALIEDGVLSADDDILEPCCGAGAISEVLTEEFGFKNVRCSDVQTADCIKGVRGIDVYDIKNSSCDVVFTNPPYNLMTRKEAYGGSMLKEFLRIANKKVILLVNVFFLSGKERKALLESSGLKHMYVHTDRVTMFPYGQPKPKNGGTKMFVWLVWEKGYEGRPTFSWL